MVPPWQIEEKKKLPKLEKHPQHNEIKKNKLTFETKLLIYVSIMYLLIKSAEVVISLV